MIQSDEHNLELAHSAESVDATNAGFYGRFQYPWKPMVFDCPLDPDFERVMLNQSIGSWDHSAIPRKPKIWIGGCGTNQAVFTALRYPEAIVVGSDLSKNSLETAASSARMVGVTNLTLRQESLNQVKYDGEFDYVICTGVIHHNADPRMPLQSLARALKPGGVMELMVYNRFHRFKTTAFQKAIRLFGKSAGQTDFESEIKITRSIIPGLTIQNEMASFLNYFKDRPESELADSLLQPVEYSYTVESLEELTRGCGLEYLAPSINIFDKSGNTYNWNMEFSDARVQKLYESFPDSKRWQISNCLLYEQSPMLWFYLKRSDVGERPKSEKDLCEEFLAQRFVIADTRKKMFFQTDEGEYQPTPTQNPYPGKHPQERCRQIINHIQARPGAVMRDVLQELGIEPLFLNVQKLRLCLTTNAFPFLKAI